MKNKNPNQVKFFNIQYDLIKFLILKTFEIFIIFKNLKGNSEISILDLISETSYQMFIWPAYYDAKNLNSEKIIPVNAAIEKMDLSKKKFLKYKDYQKLFDDDPALTTLITSFYPKLSEKYARSKAANVIYKTQCCKRHCLTYLFFRELYCFMKIMLKNLL